MTTKRTVMQLRTHANRAATWMLRKPLLILLACVLLAASGHGTSEIATTVFTTAPLASAADGCDARATGLVQQGQEATAAAAATADLESTTFVEQGLAHLESPFTRATVLELNAIVKRSLSVITEFDAIRQRLRSTDEPSTANPLSAYDALSADAARARTDMDEAEKRVRSSGEPYNEEIRAAMVHFVGHVDDEIRSEAEKLRMVPHARTP